MRTESIVLDAGARNEFELLGQEVSVVSSLMDIDERLGHAVVSPFVAEEREQTDWLWLRELASNREHEWVLGRLMDATDAPDAAALSAWNGPIPFADFEGQIQVLADVLQAIHSTELKAHRALPTDSVSARELTATVNWLKAGDPTAPLAGVPNGRWKDWWNRHGFGLHCERPNAPGLPQAVWRVPGTRAAQSAVFAPGYKGYSLWGAWSTWAQLWASHGWQFHSVDFSGNGTTPLWPRAIQDEAAWSRNTYSAEARELAAWLVSLPQNQPLVLIGHSRGAVSTLHAARIAEARGMELKAVILLAPVAHLRRRFPQGEALEAWRQTDRLEVRNARTGQVLVHPYRFFQDFIEHEQELDPLRNVKELNSPVWVFHAKDDAAVSPDEGRDLAAASRNGQFHLLSSGGHTLGTKEPWDSGEVSFELLEVTTTILRELK